MDAQPHARMGKSKIIFARKHQVSDTITGKLDVQAFNMSKSRKQKGESRK
jgi:hypothetical protein